MKFKNWFERFSHYDLDKSDYEKTKPYINEDALKMSKTMSYVGFFTMAVLLIASFIFPKLSVFTPIYGSFLGVFLIFSILFLALKDKPRYGLACYYVVALAFYVFGFTLSLVYPSGKAAIVHLEIAILPMLFTDKPFRSWSYSALITISYIILIMFFKDASIRFEEGFNAVTLFVLGMATHWIMGKSRCKGYLASYHNGSIIVELEATRLELLKETNTDALTGLKNRRSLYSEFAEISKGASPSPTALIMIDIDDFKKVNDFKGHLVGDLYLSALGTMLLSFGKEGHVDAYRYGGEEFIALIYRLDETETAKLAETIRHAAETLKLENGGRITLSLGYTVKESEGEAPIETWLDHADQSLYSAKASGKNCVKKYLGK